MGPGGLVISIVHFGSVEPTWRCLESFLRHEAAGQPILVSDQGPGPALENGLKEEPRFPQLRITRRENLGFGAGCNASAAAAFAAGARWVWFLNNDAFLESSVAGSLMELAAAFPGVGLWGMHQRDRGRRIGADALPPWFPTPKCPTAPVEGLPPGCRQLGARETLSGASILVSREAWERLGPWPEWCFLYWEDVAWCLRAHAIGLPMVLTDLEVAHARSAATGRRSFHTTYYGVRNSLLLHEELWPSRSAQRLRQAFHLLQKRFFQGNWRMLAPTLRGILDARRGIRFRKAGTDQLPSPNPDGSQR